VITNNDPQRTGAEYKVELRTPSTIKPEELEACFAIVKEGNAVSVASMKRDLPRATVLVIARAMSGIVGVGVIKPVRKQYAAGIAKKSGFGFPVETPELGYVAVHPNHRKRGLSHRITEALLSREPKRVFATTDDAGMKKTLLQAGFSQKGKEWPGKRGMLSYWERG